MCTCEWYVCVCIFMCVVYIVYMSGVRVCMSIYVYSIVYVRGVCASVCLYTCVGMRARSQQQFECHPSGAVNFFLFFSF